MKINTLIGTDVKASLGDAAGAMRGLWADVAQEQANMIDMQTVAAFVSPENFTPAKVAPVARRVVTLKRTFNMSMAGQTLKFWRVTGPETHPNYMSDLSVLGLKEWGIL